MKLAGMGEGVDSADDPARPRGLYPVRLASCPRMMLTPTAEMNPTITVFDTNRNIDPSRKNPAASIATPVSTDRVNKARAESLAECTAGTSAMTMAMAPVAWTAMNAELVKREPPTVPNR